MNIYANIATELLILVGLIIIMVVFRFSTKKHNIQLRKGWFYIQLGCISFIIGTVIRIFEDINPCNAFTCNLLDGLLLYLLGFIIVTKGIISWFPLINTINSTTEFIELSKEHIKSRVSGNDHKDQETFKSKVNFLSGISEELKDQLNNITGYIDLILSMDIPQEQKRYLREATYSTESLDFLLNSINDLHTLQIPEKDIENKPFSISDIKSNLLESYQPIAEKKKINLDLFIDRRLPLELIGDREKIYLLISKFIENSIINTDKGFIKIDIYPGVQVDNGIYLNVQIRDTGNPLPSNYLNLVETYCSQTINNSRLGLGVSLAYRIISQLKGGIDIEKSRLSSNEIVNISIPLKTA